MPRSSLTLARRTIRRAPPGPEWVPLLFSFHCLFLYFTSSRTSSSPPSLFRLSSSCRRSSLALSLPHNFVLPALSLTSCTYPLNATVGPQIRLLFVSILLSQLVSGPLTSSQTFRDTSLQPRYHRHGIGGWLTCASAPPPRFPFPDISILSYRSMFPEATMVDPRRPTWVEMTLIAGVHESLTPICSQYYKRAVYRAAPRRFEVDSLPPTKFGSLSLLVPAPVAD
jgi:hypothetical protein